MQNKSFTDIFGVLMEILAIFGVLFQFLIILGAWNLLPDSVPVHFNLIGQPDAWGDRTDLLLLFGLSVLFYFGLTFLGRYPEKFNYPWQINERNAERQYALARNFIKVIKCESVWLFTIISLKIIGVALGSATGLGYLFVPLVVTITSATIIAYFIIASRSALNDVE